MTDDLTIVKRVLAGDIEAFRILVDRHQEMMIAVLTRFLGNPDTAEELAQEAFVRAYQGLSGFRGEARFSTWLIQIALHLSRNELKRRQRMGRVISLDELQDRSGLDSEEFRDTRPGSYADGELENQELGERLKRALNQIPSSYREVFVLKHVQELGYEEISKITGHSVGSLKVRAHRARGLLRKEMQDETGNRSGDAAQSRR